MSQKKVIKTEKSKQDEINKLSKLKEELTKNENDIKTKKAECIRTITDSDIELKFLNAKLQFQIENDQKELQELNDKIREYKEQIMQLNQQIIEIEQNTTSPPFILLKEEENDLTKEIEKLRKEKTEKEQRRLENKKIMKDINKTFEFVENERIKVCQEIQYARQCILKLENLKSALETKF